MRSVATDARKGLEPEYECTSLAGPHCRTHGPTGDLLSDELSASSAEDGSLLIQLDDTTLGKDGKIDLAKVIEMFGGAMANAAFPDAQTRGAPVLPSLAHFLRV